MCRGRFIEIRGGACLPAKVRNSGEVVKSGYEESTGEDPWEYRESMKNFGEF